MSTNKTFSRLQLEAARKKLWHQDGAGLLTLDAAAEWLEGAGLVPYLPLTEQLPAPVPSFVEAVLGRPEKGHIVPSDEPLEEVSLAVEVEEREPEEDETEEPETDKNAEPSETPVAAAPPVKTIDGFTPDEMETAKRMLARLVSEGAAVPLRLLGGVGDMPDFLCSPQVFSFVYTLRGDKGWKQPPVTSGGMKVSTLALHVWEALKDKGVETVADLTVEMGSGVTQAAVGRALGELWSIARVMPVPSVNDETKWEILTGRFIRHIKAGSNAGQPTALSALLSLYLGQAIAATSEDAEVFLSPLAPRSKVREIVNALSGQRQLESNVADGKTYYYIPGTLPEFEHIDEPVVEEVEQVSRYERPERTPSKYPVRTPAGKRESFGRDDKERRPFKRDGDSAPRERRSFGGDKPAFSRPRREEGEGRPYTPRERKPFTPREGGERRPFTPREGGERRSFAPRGDGERRPYTRKPFTPREGGDRPYRRREEGEGGERRSFTPRGDGERRPYQRREGGDRPFRERKPFTPREGGERRPYKPREEGGERRSFTPRSDGERRPYQRREGGDRPFRERKPFTPREGGERRAFTPRGDGERKPYARKPFTPREGGERRPYKPREEGGERRSFKPRAEGDRPFRPRTEEGGERKPYARKPFTPREGGERKSFGAKREGGFGVRKSFGGSSRGPSAGAKFGGKSSGFAKKKSGPVSRKGPGFGPARGGAPKRRSGDGK